MNYILTQEELDELKRGKQLNLVFAKKAAEQLSKAFVEISKEVQWRPDNEFQLAAIAKRLKEVENALIQEAGQLDKSC